MKPKIIYMGTPEFAVAPLDALVRAGYPVAAVVTVPDKPSGRGLKVSMSDVKKYALQAGLPLLQPVSLKDPAFLQELAAFGADLFIVVAFRMLPRAVWAMPRLGTFNLHASLLPQYRGAAPINWCLIHGEERTGVTTFMIDQDIDTGAILLQAGCGIQARESAGTLHDKLMRLGADLVLETVAGLEAGTLVPRPQPSAAALLREAPKLTRELGRISWGEDADRTDRLIRGLSPYPAASSRLCDGEKTFDLKIYRTGAPANRPELLREIPEAERRPGRILSDNKSFLAVLCGDGRLLEIEELQLAGKKRMGVKEFLAGFRNASAYSFL